MTGLLAVAAAHHRELREAIRHRELVPAVRAAVPRIVPLVRQVLALFGITLPSRPAVSVITPTWQRHDLLTGRCIPSVRDQLYGGTVEHVIVSDGPDESLAARVPGVAFLPDHQLARNRGVRARAHGTALASHGILGYLDDDNAWRPRHLEVLAGALLASGADFAYSRALCHGDGITWAIGSAPPSFAQVDTSLIVHRRGLLALGGWQPSPGPADWDLVRRWLAAGASWAFVPEVTLDYYVREPGPEVPLIPAGPDPAGRAR